MSVIALCHPAVGTPPAHAPALGRVPAPGRMPVPGRVPAPAPFPEPRIPHGAPSSTRPTRVVRQETAPGDGLLRLLAAGHEASWREVVGRYERLVRSAARTVVRDQADIDDAVQRTWIILLTNAMCIKDVDRLPAWLAVTARREALSIARAQQREMASPEVAELLGVDSIDISRGVLEEELHDALHRAVDALPDPQRNLIRAQLRETQSYDALSRELGVPRGSLGPMRGRAVAALRARLQPDFA